ncbi:LAMI_0E10902g1_1 [Lachancea mirantina]|uniref:LAMI_0E10902g1_1 n=1 Tax=Lachancea mirantina TaxID=1230905 RepID=A0A1G4JPN7_9SACH|nr:LAMI_0E10902g1_1 [Lachancea mirantina]
MSSMLSEVESMDSLPFVRDVTPSFESNDRIMAPSIEEVDSNPEELRNIRGKGRYFGLEDPEDAINDAEPKCINCSQRGHFKRNCPHVICTYCGSMDDHYSQHCPKAIKCANCNEEGHYRSQCPHKWKRVYCSFCNSKKHARDRCPSIWRSYYLLDSSKKRILPIHRIFCYNCGMKGHLGDDCLERRSSRVPNEDGSAFSGDNLPKGVKNDYFKCLAKNKRERGRFPSIYGSDDDEDSFQVNDYEFDDASYDREPVLQANGRKKRKREESGTDRGSQRYNKSMSTFYPPPYQRSGRVPEPSSKGTVLPPKKRRNKDFIDYDRGNDTGNFKKNDHRRRQSSKSWSSGRRR